MLAAWEARHGAALGLRRALVAAVPAVGRGCLALAATRQPGQAAGASSHETMEQSEPQHDTDQQQQQQPGGAPRTPARPSPTHFVSLRVSHSPQVVAAITRVQEQLVERCPELQPCLLEPITAHLTIMVLNLPTKEHEAAAQAVLCSLVPVLQQQGLGQLTLQLAGLSTFRNQVLFLDVAPGPARDQLQRLGDAVLSHVQAAGSDLVLEAERSRCFTPHVTVAKTSRLKGARRRGGSFKSKRVSIPADAWSDLAEVEAGSVDVTELQICSLSGRIGGQFYRVTHTLQLPGAAPAAAPVPQQGRVAAAKGKVKRVLQALVCGGKAAAAAADQEQEQEQEQPPPKLRRIEG